MAGKMPVHQTTHNGKPAYQWGDSGKKYTYTPGDEESRKRAKAKAEAQGRAAHAHGYGKTAEATWSGAIIPRYRQTE